MKTILLALLLLAAALPSIAQKSPKAEAGARMVYFFKNEEPGVAADFLLQLPSKGGGSIGAGLTPIYIKGQNEFYVIAFADLRTPVSRNLSFSFQPGYNFYNYPFRVFNWSPFVLHETKTEGRFCAGLGLTWNLSPQKALGQYVQVKYHYFRFEQTTKSYSNPSTYEIINKTTTNSAISIGAGVRF